MNAALKILIVEDDISFALDLEILLEDMGYEVLSALDNAEEAQKVILETPPGAILMDIDLKGEMTGLDLAEKIKHLQIPVLFITSYQDQQKYDHAHKLGSVGYLVKPLSSFTLRTALDACFSPYLTKNVVTQSKEGFNDDNGLTNEALIVKKGNIYHKLNLNDVIYISSEREYVRLQTSKGKFLFRESLKSLENKLIDLNFFRAHHSYLINLNLISSIDTSGGQVVMSNNEKIPVSRRRKKELESIWQMV